jgi:hypothetical protein
LSFITHHFLVSFSLSRKFRGLYKFISTAVAPRIRERIFFNLLCIFWVPICVLVSRLSRIMHSCSHTFFLPFLNPFNNWGIKENKYDFAM